MGFIRGAVYSNVFVGIVLTLLAMSSYSLIAELSFNWYLPISVFLGSFVLYNFHRLYKIDFIPIHRLSARHEWMLANGTHIKYGMAISVLIAMLILPNYDAKDVVWLVPAAMVSIGYTVPVIPTESKWWRLRDIPLAKPLIISLVVTYLTLCFPIYEQFEIRDVFQPYNLTLFIERCVFLVSVTIPFEMRDIGTDKEEGLATLATYLGFDLSKRLAFSSLALWFFLFEWRVVSEHNLALVISGLIILALGVVGIWRLNESKKEMYFVLAFEGLIAVYAILMLLFA